MKKMMLALLTVALLLAGCGESDSSESKSNDNVSIYVDKEVGCQYLLYDTGWSDGGTSITPRMGRDGKQICD